MNRRFNTFSTAYKRWKTQLTALREGKLRTVKRIAREAHYELEARTQIRQMRLTLSSV